MIEQAVVRPIPPGYRGVDTVTVLLENDCHALRQGGFEFVVRYLDSLTEQEIEAILNAGLGLVGCRYSRAPGWHPTPDLGASDGILTVTKARTLGLPGGMAIACDLEGPDPATSPQEATGYLDQWSQRVTEAGYVALLYVGYGCILTGAELGSLRYFTHYWRSCSLAPEVTHGYCMLQARPPNIRVLGIDADVDFVENDWHDPPRTPPALWAA